MNRAEFLIGRLSNLNCFHMTRLWEKAYSRINFLVVSRYMWIGLLRGSSSEQFAWVHTSPPILYSNWAIEEPNNLHGRGENCGHIYIWKGDKAMQWNDELCVNPTIGPMIFMCEMKPLDLELKPINSGNSVIEGGSGEGESGSGGSASGWASGDVNTFPSRLD